MLPSGQTRLARSRILEASSDGHSDLREDGPLSSTAKVHQNGGSDRTGGWLKMAIVEYALCQAHRNNIERYERLLRTHLTDIERDYIELRLSEERDALQFVDSGLRGVDRPTSESLAPP
jgi:hypothetical protein